MELVNCVFEGGGIKGISFVGALKALEEENIQINKVAGTSVGSLIATLIAAGYKSIELEHIMKEYNFLKLKQKTKTSRIPLVGKTASLILNRGIYQTNELERWISKLLERKGVKTFSDLKLDLKIIAADVTSKEIVIFPDDFKKYKLPKDFPVAKAVAISCSIPLFFKPTKLNKNTIVDGGIIANYPIWIFKDNAIKTIGFMIKEDYKENKKRGIITYIHHVLETMASRDNTIVDLNYGQNKTVKIKINNIEAIEFGITKKQKIDLYKNGYKYTKKYLKCKKE